MDTVKEELEGAIFIAETTVGLVHGNGGDETSARLSAQNDVGDRFSHLLDTPEVRRAISNAIDVHYEL